MLCTVLAVSRLLKRRTTMGKLILLVTTCFASACARPDYAHSWPGEFILTGGSQPGYAIKRVVEKQGPATLIADDGSLCRTSPERFGDTKEGAWIACVWALPNFDPTELATLD